MKVEIIAIGDELLYGNVINTNAAFLSKELKKMGLKVNRHLVLSDEETSLAEGLKESLGRDDLIIVTGGLGPTEDDRTKKVAAALFHLELEYNHNLAEDLFQKFGENKYKKEQALLPRGALILKNEIGTAPGFIFEKDQKALILLPGVPYEMEKMFFSYLPSYIKRKFDLKAKLFEESLSICLKKEDDIEPILENLRQRDEKVNIGIYPSLAGIRVGFSVEEKDEKSAKARIAPLKQELEKAFSRYVFFSENGSYELTEAIKDIFIQKGKTLALAESCTGGAISSALTALPGTSSYFLGSVVSYANELKENVLHVPEKILKEFGAVSRETASHMVKGIFEITSADYALAVSGIAGPNGGSLKKPVGTVCFALARRGEKIDSGQIHIPGDRNFIIKYSVGFALSLLWVKISHNLSYFIP
jgi:nicotinamide-nucleotide amidase